MYCQFQLLLLLCLSASVFASAIPMWEYLSREEKVNHLYHIFASQVEKYCETTTIPDCKKVLLLYGLQVLEKMDNSTLDRMDPYQKDAFNIVWDSMMKGIYLPTGNMTPTSEMDSTKINTLEIGPNGGNNLGSQEEASSQVQHYVHGDTNFLTGPMVIRLLPNGKPVPGESADLPLVKDEDAEEHKIMRVQSAPTVREIMNGTLPIGYFFELPGSNHTDSVNKNEHFTAT